MTLGVILGSFDPIHRGHQWMVEQLQAHFDTVRLLVPAAHFEKSVCFPRNATLAQRVEMINLVYRDNDSIQSWVTREVLFVRLAQELGPSVGFGMGRDTHRKLLDSRKYFERVGLRWGREEQEALERLIPRVVVFERGEGTNGSRAPGDLRHISSTRVRGIAAELNAADASDRQWQQRLHGMVEPTVAAFIRRHGLYREPG